MVKTSKMVNTFTDYARDGLGMLTSGVLTGALGEIGAAIGIWLGPQIAVTSTGKQFNRMLGILLFVDALGERFTPKGVM